MSMKSKSGITRRDVLGAAGVAAAGIGLPAIVKAADKRGAKKGRINQSVCKWCYRKVSFEDLAAHSAKIGLKGLDLASPNQWPALKKHGLVCTMTPSHGIGKGLNRIANHAECLGRIRKAIEDTSDAGFRNVICFSGNRAGMDDNEGLKNCEIAIKQIVGLAEKKNITICMELLNSKRNHKGYMCDRTHWGGELVRRIGSPRFQLLYDIYHMQVQEGDVIATIKEYKDCIGHYHTAGVPGRNEIDETQELYYPPIMKAIVETGFKGYVGQEFIPKKDALTSLTNAVEICDV